jgi:hypothetical protein
LKFSKSGGGMGVPMEKPKLEASDCHGSGTTGKLMQNAV